MKSMKFNLPTIFFFFNYFWHCTVVGESNEEWNIIEFVVSKWRVTRSWVCVTLDQSEDMEGLYGYQKAKKKAYGSTLIPFVSGALSLCAIQRSSKLRVWNIPQQQTLKCQLNQLVFSPPVCAVWSQNHSFSFRFLRVTWLQIWPIGRAVMAAAAIFLHPFDTRCIHPEAKKTCLKRKIENRQLQSSASNQKHS